MFKVMKKVLYSIVGVFALIGVGFSSYLAYDIFFNPLGYWEEEIDGYSMEEYGFMNGETYWYYPKLACLPGDNCRFECLTERCTYHFTSTSTKPITVYLKHLVSIEDDCYWFEGNKNSFIVNDQEYESFDSRSYGCLKPNEFEISGVAIPAPNPSQRTTSSLTSY